MTTDQLIQLGMLILAALTLVGTAGYKIYGWIASRSGLQFHLRSIGGRDAYIYRIASQHGAPYVESVAIFARTHLYNDTSQPVIITQIRAGYKGHSKQPVIGFPFGELIERGGSDVQLRGPRPLPFTIDAGEALDLWSLTEAAVGSEVGETLLVMFGGEARKCEDVQKYIYHFDEVEKIISQKMKADERIPKAGGFRVLEHSIPAINMHTKLLWREGKRVSFAPIFGFVPADSSLDINVALADIPGRRRPRHRTGRRYEIQIVTAAEKTLCVGKAAEDPLWFLHRQNW